MNGNQMIVIVQKSPYGDGNALRKWSVALEQMQRDEVRYPKRIWRTKNVALLSVDTDGELIASLLSDLRERGFQYELYLATQAPKEIRQHYDPLAA